MFGTFFFITHLTTNDSMIHKEHRESVGTMHYNYLEL